MFFIGFDLLFLPLLIGLFLIGLSGIITVPIGIFKFIKQAKLSNWLLKSIGLAIGFYLGLAFQQPINNWNENQRNLSGRIIATELENYKNSYGNYPEDLKQLNLNNDLPIIYKVEKFTYNLSNDGYDLDIPVHIFDRYHWNKTKKEFEYSDF